MNLRMKSLNCVQLNESHQAILSSGNGCFPQNMKKELCSSLTDLRSQLCESRQSLVCQ